MRPLTGTRPLALLLALLFALALPATAFAQGEDVIRDCAQDGDLDGDYSDEELDRAYNNLPTDIDEYSDCRDVIRQAQAGGRGNKDVTGADDSGSGGVSAGGGNGGTGTGYRDGVTGGDVSDRGGSAADNEDLKRREDAARSGARPGLTDPASGADDSGSGLPAAAIVAIVLLALAGLLGLLYALRDRLPPGLTSRLPGSGPGPGR
jgi:hypothetical protein